MQQKKNKKTPAKRLKRKATAAPERGKKQRRFPISLTRVRRLGYRCHNIIFADAIARTSRSLTDIFKTYPPLKAEWERGQFLRNLQAEAGSAPNVPRAASHLGFKSGAELRDLLDEDAEAKDVWDKARLALNVAQNKRVFDLAAEGSKWAIQLVEKFLTADENDDTAMGGVNMARVRQKDLVELFGVSRDTIHQWTNTRNLPRNPDKTYSLADVIRWYTVFAGAKTTAKVTPASEKERLKNVRLAMDNAARRHELLSREEVTGRWVQFWELMVATFRYKKREIATQVHGHTVDNAEKILERNFEEIQRAFCEVPEVLDLPPAATAKFEELIEIIRNTEDGKDK